MPVPLAFYRSRLVLHRPVLQYPAARCFASSLSYTSSALNTLSQFPPAPFPLSFHVCSPPAFTATSASSARPVIPSHLSSSHPANTHPDSCPFRFSLHLNDITLFPHSRITSQGLLLLRLSSLHPVCIPCLHMRTPFSRTSLRSASDTHNP